MNKFNNWRVYLAIAHGSIAPISVVVMQIYSLVDYNLSRNEDAFCFTCSSVSCAIVHNKSFRIANDIIITLAMLGLVFMFAIRNEQIRKLDHMYDLNLESWVKWAYRFGLIGFASILIVYYCDIYLFKTVHVISAAMLFAIVPISQIMYGCMVYWIRKAQRREHRVHCYYDAILCIGCAILTVAAFIFYLSGYLSEGGFPDGIFYYGEWIAITSLTMHFALYAIIIWRDHVFIELETADQPMDILLPFNSLESESHYYEDESGECNANV